MGEEVEEKAKRVIEAWARRYCKLRGIDPDRDWRDGDGGFLEVAIRDEDAPNWRHHYAIPVERLLRDLAEQGVCLSRAASPQANNGESNNG